MSYPKDLSISQIENDFLAAMDAAGVRPASGDRIVADGKKYRYKVHDDKRGSKSGEYALYMNGYPDGCPAGWFHCYKNDLYKTWALAGGEQGVSLTDKEREEMFKKIEQKKKEAELWQQREVNESIHRARQRWEASTSFENFKNHPYVERKRLPAIPGARRLGNDIILPVVNAEGEIMTVQTILPDGGKRFQKGAPKKGNFILLEEREKKRKTPVSELEPAPAQRVWLCEGYATAVTIWTITGDRVVAALDAYNLMPVANNIRKAYPDMEIIGAPDFDRKRGNIGMARMFEVQNEFGIPVVYPRFDPDEEGSDWNDYFCLRGAKATRKAMKECLEAAHVAPGYKWLRRENLYPMVKDDGKPLKTEENLVALLRYLGIKTRYNVITKKREVFVPGRNFNFDNEQNAIDGYIASKCVENGLPEKTWEAYSWAVTSRDFYNPVKDWILSAPWDGTPRLPELLESIRVPASYSNELKETLITRWLISAVAAVFCEGGYHGRGVLALQGDQSIGKTTWFKNLVPSEFTGAWFGEGVVLNIENKDSVKAAVSKWITELGELEGTFKRSELNKLKGFVTLEQDELRLPYAKAEANFPRRTVFAATVNDVNFLIDDTGNTRWWVIECLSVNFNHGIDMQQLWAEIYEVEYTNGERWYLTREEEIKLEEQNQEYKVPSVVEDLLSRKLKWNEEETFWFKRTLTEVLIECGIDRPTTSDIQKAARYVKRITGQKSERKGRSRKRLYRLPSVEKHPGEDIS